ncbi:MAG TPA: hypothetical protein GX742_00095 [Acholeplasmataceae bacterium]|nr:hypothetical protein [Acholeplasmataceae bacterium]
MFKKIITAIFEPFKLFSSKGISEGTSNFFTKHPYAIYIVTFLISALVIYFTYKI